FLLLVLFEEELSAGKFLRRRALAEGQYPFGERSETFDECIRDDPGSALENRLDAQFVHLRTDAHADWRQAAEVNHFGPQFLDLGKFCVEVLLVGSNTESAENRAAVRGQIFGEILVVALTVIRGVVNNHPLLEFE